MEPGLPAQGGVRARSGEPWVPRIWARTLDAVDDAQSVIPRISRIRRPMDSIPSLGTAPVDATVSRYYGRERPGYVKTGKCRAFPPDPIAHRQRIPGEIPSIAAIDSRSAGIAKGQVSERGK